MPRIIRSIQAVIVAGLLVGALASAALAAHNTVTVAVTSSTRDAITGTIQVKNTIAAAQTGKLTLILFEVKQDGSVQERARQDLGAVAVAGSGSTIVSYTVDTREGPLRKGVFILLADYASAIGGNPVPHTHCGTITLARDL